MSDISANSSFERFSDSDDSDVRRDRIQAEAVQAQARLSEERRKLHQQEKKLADAKAGGVLIGVLISSACFMVIFLGMVICAILSGPRSVRHNANPIVEKKIQNESPIVIKFNVTMGNLEKVYDFPEEKKQKIKNTVGIEKEEFHKFIKMSEIRKSFQEKTYICQVPANLRDKFIPDYSRFDGVVEFLHQTQTNGTIVEDYLYYSAPRFQIDTGISYVQFVNMETLEEVEDFWIGDCLKPSRRCHHFHWFIQNGDLHIRETYVLKSQEYKFTRVYFIPPHEMI